MQKLYLSATIFIALLSVLHKPAPAISVENVAWPQELPGCSVCGFGISCVGCCDFLVDTTILLDK